MNPRSRGSRVALGGFQFPPPDQATPDGLLAIGGDLSVDRLLSAYRQGIFPWFSEGDPILWWCPDPRMIIVPEEFHVSRSLQRTLRRKTFSVTSDTAFEAVIDACAAPSGPTRDSTWITCDMRRAYLALHEAGYAHSFETWHEGELAGGLYGVSIGACFFGESMFSRRSDASKVAAERLARFASQHNWPLIDCQVPNEHLRSLGAREIPRRAFLEILGRAVEEPTLRGPWTVD